MPLVSSLLKLPRWTLFVIAISVLLFAMSIGLISFDRSEGSRDAIVSDASPIEIGKLPGKLTPKKAGASADPEGAKRPTVAESDPVEPQADPSEEDSWLGVREPGGDLETTGLAGLDCVIEPHQIVSIRSSVSGMIEAIHFERGDAVEEGQVLVELESSAERAAVAIARNRAEMNSDLQSREAALELSKRRSDRAGRLYASNALALEMREEVDTEAELARFELQRAADEHDLAKLQHREALERLKRRTIRSPISGIVIERLMSRGEVVDDEVILRLAQINPLRVEIVLPASSFGSIEPGTKAAVVPEIPGDEVHVGLVTIVDRMIDAASGTFGARIELPNLDGSIPSGLHCQVRFLDE